MYTLNQLRRMHKNEAVELINKRCDQIIAEGKTDVSSNFKNEEFGFTLAQGIEYVKPEFLYSKRNKRIEKNENFTPEQIETVPLLIPQEEPIKEKEEKQTVKKKKNEIYTDLFAHSLKCENVNRSRKSLFLSDERIKQLESVYEQFNKINRSDVLDYVLMLGIKSITQK